MFSFTLSGWLGARALLTWGTHGTRMHYGEKTRRRRQYNALGNVLLGNHGSCHPCGCYFDMYNRSWKLYSLMAVASFSRIMPQSKNGLKWFEKQNDRFEELTWPPISPDLNPIEHLWGVVNKQVWSMEAPPCKLQDLKDLLLTQY